MSAKADSVEDAVDRARRNYGEEIDIGALMSALEDNGWRYEG